MRKKAKNENKHTIHNMKITTSSNSFKEIPEVLIYFIDFVFSGVITPKDYEQMIDQLYNYMYKKYPQDRKIIHVNMPEVESYKYNWNSFSEIAHRCSIEVYQLNENKVTYAEWQQHMVNEELKTLCMQINDIFMTYKQTINLPTKNVQPTV